MTKGVVRVGWVVGSILLMGACSSGPKSPNSYGVADPSNQPQNRQGIESRRWLAGTALVLEGVRVLAGAKDGSVKMVEGICLLDTEASTISTPCPTLEILVLDPEGKTLERTRVENGQFHFSSQPKAQYHLELASKEYEWVNPESVDERREPASSLVLHVRKRGPNSGNVKTSSKEAARKATKVLRKGNSEKPGKSR